MRDKTKGDYHTKDMYKYYLEHTEDGLAKDYQKYSKVINRCNSLLLESILNNPELIKLPVRFGTLGVRKSKISTNYNKIPVDWKATNELWGSNPKAKEEKILVKHLNEERRGYIYKIYWSKKGMNNPGHKLYKFMPSRGFKRALSSILKNDSTMDYYLY